MPKIKTKLNRHLKASAKSNT